MMCRVLCVSRSGFYAWRQRPPSARSREDVELGEKIDEVFKESRGRYGSPRVHVELRTHHNIRVGRKRVARLMRLKNLVARRKRRFRKTTDSNHGFAVAPNRLKRNFKVNAPNKAWVADITYLWTREGWLYLAVILDLFSRRVVGWAMADHLRAELALSALRMALLRRRPKRGLIHHSDRGVQYACDDYQAILRAHGIKPSMSRKGDCWDNAVAESFFGTMELELVDESDWQTHDEARAAVFEYVEAFYNGKRIHSTTAYLSPAEFERCAS
jgi:transposase InsO family protein